MQHISCYKRVYHISWLYGLTAILCDYEMEKMKLGNLRVEVNDHEELFIIVQTTHSYSAEVFKILDSFFWCVDFVCPCCSNPSKAAYPLGISCQAVSALHADAPVPAAQPPASLASAQGGAGAPAQEWDHCPAEGGGCCSCGPKRTAGWGHQDHHHPTVGP